MIKTFSVGCFVVLVGITALAQQPPQQQAPQPLVVHQVKPDTYWIEGGGGSTGFVIGTNGVVAIDAKTTPAGGKEMLEDIAKVTPKPVTHVILTHSDADHVNGLAAFPAGLTIIAHENNKKEQELALRAGGRGAPPADRQPTRIVTNKNETMTLDGVKVELYHWANAHTGGDLTVFLPAQKVVFTGDIAATNHPFARIHTEGGKSGSSAGWIESMKGMLTLDAETYITGHGNPQTKADLQKHIASVEERRAAIRQLVMQGKSVAEVVAALPDSECVAGQPGVAGPQGLCFTEVVYQEFSKR